MSYDNAFIEKVKAFGVLGYPAHEIAFLVDPEDPEQFETDLQDTQSVIYRAYHKGKVTGQYTMDKALFDAAKANDADANEKLNRRQHIKILETAIREKFNL
ncbi:MAG: hypothetical protein LBR26_13370 [Prevotella sp.]|jgi:uncharacterized lipoprotein YehR (DUF1307 family)|nr:hypothetical protein [Prevotella sp.]